jgi:hypothetical protein
MDHVSNCFDVGIARQKSSPENANGLKCAHLYSRCAVPFDSVLQLRFHYEDVHCVSFAKGTKRRLSDTEIEVDRRADTEAARPEELRNMTPNTAKVKGTCQRRAQQTFVPETGKRKKTKTKSTNTSAATLRSRASPRATPGLVNNQIVLPREGPLATADQRSSVPQDLASSNKGISNPPSDGQVGGKRRYSGRSRMTRNFLRIESEPLHSYDPVTIRERSAAMKMQLAAGTHSSLAMSIRTNALQNATISIDSASRVPIPEASRQQRRLIVI